MNLTHVTVEAKGPRYGDETIRAGGVNYHIPLGGQLESIPQDAAEMICRKHPDRYRIKPASMSLGCSDDPKAGFVPFFHTEFPEHTFRYGGHSQTIAAYTLTFVPEGAACLWSKRHGFHQDGTKFAFMANRRWNEKNKWWMLNDETDYRSVLVPLAHYFGIECKEDDRGGKKSQERERVVPLLMKELWLHPMTEEEVLQIVAGNGQD